LCLQKLYVALFFYLCALLKSITNHLNKAVDFVAIDLKGASKDQVKAIKDFVGGLAKDQQNRIKYVQ
jgi:hypothetical protein